MPDSTTISPAFLDKNIEYASKVRAEKKWNRNISDSLFNEYILPYRVANERVDLDWREHLYQNYNFYEKGNDIKLENFNKIKDTDMLAFANEVQSKIVQTVDINSTMWSYPFDIPVSKMEQGRSQCH